MAVNILHLNMMNNHFVAPRFSLRVRFYLLPVMTSEILCVSPVEKNRANTDGHLFRNIISVTKAGQEFDILRIRSAMILPRHY